MFVFSHFCSYSSFCYIIKILQKSVHFLHVTFGQIHCSNLFIFVDFISLLLHNSCWLINRTDNLLFYRLIPILTFLIFTIYYFMVFIIYTSKVFPIHLMFFKTYPLIALIHILVFFILICLLAVISNMFLTFYIDICLHFAFLFIKEVNIEKYEYNFSRPSDLTYTLD